MSRVPKAEFSRRLVRLHRVLDRYLYGDGVEGNLFPYLFSVYAYIWSFPKDYLFKKPDNKVLDLPFPDVFDAVDADEEDYDIFLTDGQ